jgi:very-short-patch-repair endonuclease
VDFSPLAKKTEGEKMKEYNKANIPLAKVLRKNMTPWERKLWYDFLKEYPIRFQRQKTIGNYIVDFYCAKARLVIELDGGGHYTKEQTEKDDLRTKDLVAANLTVVRICNLDIDRNFRGVCEYIDLAVKSSLPQSATLTAPSSEGALDVASSKK